MKLLGRRRRPAVAVDAVRFVVAADAAPFDSVPGPGFDVDPDAAAIVPPAGRLTGSGAALVARPGAEQHVPRDQSCVEGRRDGAVRRTAATSSADLSDAQQHELVKSLALVRGAHRATGGQPMRQTAHRAVPAVERQHGRRLDAMAARAVRLRVRDPASGGLQVAAGGEGRRRDPCRRCAAADGGGGRPWRSRRRTLARRATGVRRHCVGRTICARSSSSSAPAGRSSA